MSSVASFIGYYVMFIVLFHFIGAAIVLWLDCVAPEDKKESK